ncbi:tumor necrosis factor receptor superfamily member 10B-like [Egretta garzetta]|uniref:tumor necrosis factor receptor superfamily member 10B-like n=1 Tax=Egretta garzetta TaxID=188379 RepID=UPI00163C8AF9|nr:tumor necrosis factor receptor superfamily member 10B-like [Egretta garzetta]
MPGVWEGKGKVPLPEAVQYTAWPGIGPSRNPGQRLEEAVLGTVAVALHRRDQSDASDPSREEFYLIQDSGHYGKKCPAGTYVAESYRNGSSKCSPCKDNEYTEYPNDFSKCLGCRTCREDQVEPSPCRAVRDTQCICRNGTFCSPDHPCEMCQKCRPRCLKDEVELAPCTPHSDRQCGPYTGTFSDFPLDHCHHLSCGLPCGSHHLLWVAALLPPFLRRQERHEREALQRDGELPASGVGCGGSPLRLQLLGRLEEQGGESRPCGDVVELDQAEEGLWWCPALCGALAAPSPVPLSQRCQHAQRPCWGPRVTGRAVLYGAPATAVSTSAPRQEVTAPRTSYPIMKPRRKLVPTEENKACNVLRSSFEIFAQDVPWKDWKRFGRALGLLENDIALAEMNDRYALEPFFQMLHMWQNREGLNASVNTLLETLHRINLGGIAEDISSKLVQQGSFQYETS